MDLFGDFVRYRSLEWYAQELLKEARNDPESHADALSEMAAVCARMQEISQEAA